MESTKVISLRIDRKFYNEILLECNEKDIGVSVWLETNIALAQKKKVDKEYLLSQLRIMEKIAHAQSPILEVRIKYLREYIENYSIDDSIKELNKCKSIQCTECGAEIEINEVLYQQLIKDLETIPTTKSTNFENSGEGGEIAELDRIIETINGAMGNLRGELKEKFAKILEDLNAEKERLEKIKIYKAAIDEPKNDDDDKKRWAEKVAILEKGR